MWESTVNIRVCCARGWESTGQATFKKQRNKNWVSSFLRLIKKRWPVVFQNSGFVFGAKHRTILMSCERQGTVAVNSGPSNRQQREADSCNSWQTSVSEPQSWLLYLQSIVWLSVNPSHRRDETFSSPWCQQTIRWSARDGCAGRIAGLYFTLTCPHTAIC